MGVALHRGEGLVKCYYLFSSDDPDILLSCENGRIEGSGKALKSALSLALAFALLVRRLMLILRPRVNPVDIGRD